MFTDTIFVKKYPISDGIYNCLGAEVHKDKIKKVEIATYSKRASEFEEKKMLKLTHEHQRALAPLMKLPRGSTILEVGGGNGRFAFYLMKNGYTVIESDIAVGSVQKTKSIAEKYNIPNGIFALIDAENLPFKDDSLDGIFMVASLHHLSHPGKAIAEFHRCLKKNGFLLILREPASWQYKLFGPFFRIVRKIVRKKNKKPISLADDEAHGFSIRQYKKLLSDFSDLKFEPVAYLGKYYYNFLILKQKLFHKPMRENMKIKRFLQKCDSFIKRLPILRNYPWDWDVWCVKNY